MGRRARFRGAKATPKTLEKDLLEKAKMLAEDPHLLLPRCTKECRGCDLKKAVEKMEKVSSRRMDPKKLDFSMNWGDQLVRAYAATISLHVAGKVPYLATTKTPMGEVSFAMRGKVDRDKLIGVQHFDHPELRLLALWSTAQKRGLHIYSTEKEAICSPDGPRPPAEYVEEVLSLLPYDLDDNNDCPHAKEGRGIKVTWRGGGQTVRVCPSCVKDINTVHVLASRIAAGLVGLLACFLVVAPLLPRGRRNRRIVLLLVLLLLLALFLLLLSYDGPPQGLLYEASALLHGHAEAEFGSGRLLIWQRAWALIPERPLLGGGPDTLGKRLDLVFTSHDASAPPRQARVDNAHNDYLNIAVNLGLPALLVYVAALLCTARGFLRRRCSDAVLALGAGLLCYSAQIFFSFSLCITAPIFWLFWGLLVAELAKEKQDDCSRPVA